MQRIRRPVASTNSRNENPRAALKTMNELGRCRRSWEHAAINSLVIFSAYVLDAP